MKKLISQLINCSYRGDRTTIELTVIKLLNNNEELQINWLVLGKVCASVGLYSLCLKSLENAKPFIRLIDHHLVYFSLLIDCGQQERAYTQASTLMKQLPNSAPLAHLLGSLGAQLGRFDDSQHLLEKATSLNPLAGESWLALVELDLNESQYQKNPIKTLLPLIEKPLPPISKACMHTALAKLFLKQNNKQSAIQHFEHSAALMQANTHFDQVQERQQAEIIIKTSQSFNALACQESKDDTTPIFIVGLPRSGTTLLEQLIANTDSIFATGECNAMALACMPYLKTNPIGQDKQDLLQIANNEKLSQVKQNYLTIIKEKFGHHKFIVDKSLNNNRYLDIILSIFPQSPIICIERNNQDTAWSCFKTFFSQGLSWSWSYQDIANFIDVEKHLLNQRLSKYSDNIYHVRYEELVKSPQETLKSIRNFCGLDACVSSSGTNVNNFVKTASSTQVKQKMSDKAVNSSLVTNKFLTQHC